MEKPLTAIESYALMLCSETLDENQDMALERVVGWAMRAEAMEVAKLRGFVLDGLRHCGHRGLQVIECK